MKLSNKIAIVTGSGNGIGRGIALAFAREGAAVVVATLLEEEGAAVEREIKEAGGRARFVATDIRFEADIASMVEQTVQSFGQIDILVNNAGITVFRPMAESTTEDWDRLMDLNLRGAYLCSRYAAPRMAQTGGGAIIHIASVHARATFPHAEMYASSKAGLLGLTRSMALSLGKDGIRVNAVSPGFVENSPRFRAWLERSSPTNPSDKAIHDIQALPSIVQPDDIGRLAVFLASEDSRMITGTEVVIDGGMSARLHNPF